jgi:hypothetical protein
MTIRRVLGMGLLIGAAVVAGLTALVAIPGAWLALRLRAAGERLGQHGRRRAWPTGALSGDHGETGGRPRASVPTVTDVAAWAAWLQQEERLRQGRARWQ